ncbi:MAG TPA: ADP-ribosylglycohydrolase [Opitutae bacterium]|nr:ADP-ribosylglycohydrolase [Opitutae bacterium]
MNETYQNAMLGALVADAVAMPVHWYYDTSALDNDYGKLRSYVSPKNPHSGSILWRSKYHPRNAKGDILKAQAQFWGQRGIHYHQFLKAGENTLNYKLATELYIQVLDEGTYNVSRWADRYVECMLQEGWHNDTYAEEYHRAYFDNYAQGKAPLNCGIDDLHIGGLSHVPSLLAALQKIGITELDAQLECVNTHVRLTHKNKHVSDAANALTQMLHALSKGYSLQESLNGSKDFSIDLSQFETWSNFPDRTVVGRHLSTACYLPESFLASLYLTWRHTDDFSAGILANAHCGGDNCHRGAVVGSLLAAANGISKPWLAGLRAHADLELSTQHK